MMGRMAKVTSAAGRGETTAASNSGSFASPRLQRAHPSALLS
jgi:hypothetical protein